MNKNEELHAIYEKYPKDFPLPMLLDGATGTALMRCGMPEGVCPECWAAEHRDALCHVQAGYVNAGADAIYSPTFGGNAPSLERNESSWEAGALNEALISATRDNVALSGRGVLVGGDMSPTGLFMEPLGDASFDEIVEIYASQAKSLDGGADFFVIETMISAAEARAAVTGVKSVSDKPIFVTLTVNEDGRTMSGDSMLAALLTFADMGVAAFGCNCSVGPAEMLELLAPLVPYSRALGVPLIAKPNAGMPHEGENGEECFDMTAEAFGEYAAKLLECGVCILGGCCGTDDGYIAALRRATDEAIKADRVGTALCEASELDVAGNIIAVERVKDCICSSRTVAVIDAVAVIDDTSGDGIVDVDEFFFDSICDISAAGGSYAVVRLGGVGDVEILRDSLPMISLPLVFVGDAEAFAAVKRIYNGVCRYAEL